MALPKLVMVIDKEKNQVTIMVYEIIGQNKRDVLIDITENLSGSGWLVTISGKKQDILLLEEAFKKQGVSTEIQN